MFKLFDIFHRLKESDDPVVKTINFKGLIIKIECLKGNKRDPKAEKPITADYGYIQGTVDVVESDSIDVFVGSNLNSDMVFKLRQLGTNFELNEFKYVLGFDDKLEVIKMYLDSKPPFFQFGGCEELSWEKFLDFVNKHRKTQ